MTLPLNINGKNFNVSARPTDTLLSALRGAGFFSVRFGSHDGKTGAAAVLVDGQLVNSDVMLAGQAVGHRIETVEGLNPGVNELHPIQKAFVETGRDPVWLQYPGDDPGSQGAAGEKSQPHRSRGARSVFRHFVPRDGLREAGPGGAARCRLSAR
jgi:hypothetical protein